MAGVAEGGLEGKPMHLRCESLNKSFGGVCALKGVSLDFPDAGVLAIVGPNGAGKTTLLNVLTGFLRADSGRVLVDHRDVNRLSAHGIARLGIARTFQEVRLIRQVSVLENVMLARPQQRGERLVAALLRCGVAADERANRDEALRNLAVVGLDQKARDRAGAISYGEQKLVTLACCLNMRARVFFLDEPVSGVHPELGGRILALMRGMGSEGRLVVFVEHDLAAVREVATRVVAMDEGHVIADGNPHDVLSRPEILEAYVA